MVSFFLQNIFEKTCFFQIFLLPLLCTKRDRVMKLGLVRMSGERVIGVQYFESKFNRELGEKLRINGVEWRVGVIADDKNSIIKVLNEIVRIENSLRRKENSIRRQNQRERDREIDAQITEMFIQAYKSVMN